MSVVLQQNSSGGSNKSNTCMDTIMPQAQHHNAALKNAIDYVREFSIQAAQFNQTKTDESLVYLHRTIALLGTKVPPQCFAPAHLEMVKFFIDLHAVMSTLDNESDALWACISLLQHCSRNLETRLAIVERYCYVPLLSYILKRTSRVERVQRLMLLLQDLTYGIRITWEEPYLVVLLEQLVELVLGADGEVNGNGAAASPQEDNLLPKLAFSILVNLCYKNFVVLFLFMRSVNISSFSRRVQHYGVLAYKMLIILSEDEHAFAQGELHVFLRAAFISIADELKDWNVPKMQHIVDFLMDGALHSGLHRAMLTHSNYCEDIERVLDQIDAQGQLHDGSGEIRKHQEICISLIFQLISYILQLGNSSSDNAISLQAIMPRLFEMLCDWLDYEQVFVSAIKLLNMLLLTGRQNAVAPLIVRQPALLNKLLANTERPESKAAHVTAILQLLITLLREAKTEKLVLAKISESYFDKILAVPLACQPDLLNASTYQALEQCEVEKAVYCLLLLINFAGIAKKAYFDKCSALLELPQMQYALARAMLGGSEQLTTAVFQISQFERFPTAAVAKFLANINSTKLNAVSAITQCTDSAQLDQWRNLQAILKGHRTFIDKELSQRVSTLIESITETLRKHELQQTPIAQVIELYNHRINSLTCAQENLQLRLEQASEQLNNTARFNSMQNAEIERFQIRNFELLISQERLHTQCEDLKQQKDKLKANMTIMIKQLSENNDQLQAKDRRLAVKSSELIALQKECDELRTSLNTKTEELCKLEALTKDNCTRIEKLKKSVLAYEADIKEKMRIMEERDREVTKLTKQLEEMRDARKKSEDLVCVLEKQLEEKKEQVEALELEQKETEDLRKTIMSLMESKKPKRKA